MNTGVFTWQQSGIFSLHMSQPKNAYESKLKLQCPLIANKTTDGQESIPGQQ